MTESSSHIPPDDRYCDVVMKGGITSGVVYPKFVAKLSEHYRFKNIGGTSAGAIAAVATAAAEYRRRQTDDAAGFTRLNGLADELGKTLSESNITKLLSLFQPARGCRRLFGVLVSALNAKGTYSRIVAVAWGSVRAYWLATIVAALIAMWIGSAHDAFAAALTFALALPITIGLGVYRDITRNLSRNGFGMCTGMTEDGSPHDALSPWLHELIQTNCGRRVDDPPLTFGDLWDAPGFPPQWLSIPAHVRLRSIDLRMFTTNLSTGRPFVFPNQTETCRLFYLPDELEKLLPKRVFEWIFLKSTAYGPSTHSPRSDPQLEQAPQGLLELPKAEDLPILFVARMSLSFPLLFSTIPLWAIDYDAEQGKRGFARCAFADGGISSNFPIHLFDALLPLWPTFGIQLEPKLPARNNMVYLPQRYAEGYGERWARFAADALAPATRFGGYVSAIVNTMQNWNDNTLSRMPGVRDRVVRVRLTDAESGLNLNMTPERITTLAARGAEAADVVVKRFLQDQTAAYEHAGWNEQRWIRLATLVEALAKRVLSVNVALNNQDASSVSFERLIELGRATTLPGTEGPLSGLEAASIKKFVSAMRDFDHSIADVWRDFDFKGIPETDLRVRPML